MADERDRASPPKSVSWRRRLARLLGSLVLLAVSLVVGLGMGELAVRLFKPQQLRLSWNLYRSADSIGYEHVPGGAARVNAGGTPVWVRLDKDGYRVGETGRIEGTDRKVLIIGDSFMAAIQVSYEESFAGLLERGLEEAVGEPVAVRNAGVDGYDPGQYLLTARRAMARESFDIVVAAIFTGNDVVSERQDYFPPRTRRRPQVRWPTEWTVRDISRSIIMPAMARAQYHSQLAVLLWNTTEMLRVRMGAWEWTFPKVLLRDKASSPDWNVTASICADLAALGEQRGTPVVFVLIPQFIQMDHDRMTRYAEALGIDPAQVDIDQPDRRLREAMEEQGLEVIDLLEPLRAAHRRGLAVYGDVDRHFSPEGHAVMTREVLPRVLKTLVQRPAD